MRTLLALGNRRGLTAGASDDLRPVREGGGAEAGKRTGLTTDGWTRMKAETRRAQKAELTAEDAEKGRNGWQEN